jgi:hypothetical protein
MKKFICRRHQIPLLIVVAAFILAAGCSKEKSSDGKKTWADDFKIDNQEEVLRAGSVRNLRAIRMALTLAQYPARLQDAGIGQPDLLLSPTDLVARAPALPLGFGSWPLDKQWKWAFDNCSYEYVPGQKEADGANILLFEKPKPHKKELPVYFMDGQAKLASAEQLTNLLAKQKTSGKLTDADRKPLANEPPSIK